MIEALLRSLSSFMKFQELLFEPRFLATEGLFEKIISRENLVQAFLRIRKGGSCPGVDGITMEVFEEDWVNHLKQIEDDLQADAYQPLPIRRIFIRKPNGRGNRALGIPTIRDKLVQAAFLQIMEPIFEADFSKSSFAYRFEKGVVPAHKRVEKLLEDGKHWLVDSDFEDFFDTIPHQPLQQILGNKIPEDRVLVTLQHFIAQKIRTGKREFTPTVGIAQGSVLSPLFSNIYLDSFDKFVEEAGFEMVR